MKVFISAERKELSTLENNQRTIRLGLQLSLLGYLAVPIDGCYEGSTESSYMILGVSDVSPLLFLGREFKQDSILIVSDEDDARLIFCDDTNREVNLGKMMSSDTLPEGLTNYSKVPFNNSYYYLYTKG